MRRVVIGFGWIALYLAAVIAPLVFAVAHDAPPARGFVHDLSIALGFVGLAMLGLQFAVTARIRRVAAPYGIDVVIQFHRQISYVAVLFVLAHPALLVFTDAPMAELLNPFSAPWRARFALTAVAALLTLVVTAAWRRRLRISYERWRIVHGVLAVAVLALSLLHVQLVGYYVAQPWKQVLWAAMSIAVVGLLLHVRVVRPLQLLRHPYVVTEVQPRAGDTYSVVLRPDGHPGLRFRPGQFAWLSVGSNPFAIEQHPFSFSSSADVPDRLELTIKALGDFSAAIGEIEPGTRAYLDGPYGVFTTDLHEAASFVFVAGGIGVTPVMSMLRTHADRGDHRPMLLVYGITTMEDATFAAELEELTERLDLRVVYVPAEPPPGWDGPSGFVDRELLDRELPSDREHLQCFLCGPDPMTAAVEQALHDLGVEPDHVNYERFAFV
ncbi:MAG: ferric reductase-like transmembrane domain-containing protein [Ilumatobacteraceae bacterium]